MLFHQEQDLLGRAANQRLLQEATVGAEHFEQSKTSPGRVQPEWRLSKVVYDPGLKGLAAGLERSIRARVPGVLRRLGMAPFDVGALELQLTSHNDGEFFKPHVDAGTPKTAGRMLTFVYYFHREPKAFAGGELVIVGSDGTEVTIEPENDSIVFFNSRLRHEVRRISCPSQRFEDGRFTLNGWVRRRESVATRSTFFDQRIFGPVNRWAPRAASQAGAAAAPLPGHAHASRMAELQSRLYRQRRAPDRIDEREAITGEQFFEEFYCRNRPVVLRGLVADTPAVRTWSPEWFGSQFATVPVEITAGRNDNPDYETRFRDSVRTVTMGEFVERLGSESRSNDFYLVARNYFFDNPAFHGLRDALTPPADIINPADRDRGTAKLWFGPGGTVTPLHFDEHSILFTQVHGRKRFKLIPPFESPRLYVRNGYYSAVDPESPDPARFPLFAGVPVADVVVEPGDALLLPAGWWHWARALDVSISATFCSFSVDGRNARIGDEIAAGS